MITRLPTIRGVHYHICYGPLGGEDSNLTPPPDGEVITRSPTTSRHPLMGCSLDRTPSNWCEIATAWDSNPPTRVPRSPAYGATRSLTRPHYPGVLHELSAESIAPSGVSTTPPAGEACCRGRIRTCVGVLASKPLLFPLSYVAMSLGGTVREVPPTPGRLLVRRSSSTSRARVLQEPRPRCLGFGPFLRATTTVSHPVVAVQPRISRSFRSRRGR